MGLPSFKLLFERPKNDSEVSAKIIAVYNKHLLLLQNKDGKFELPGGHIKINESLLEGAKREFFEETGIRINRLKLIRKSKKRAIFFTYLLSKGVRISNEHKAFKFVKPSMVYKMPLSDKSSGDLKYFKKIK